MDDESAILGWEGSTFFLILGWFLSKDGGFCLVNGLEVFPGYSSADPEIQGSS